MTAYNVNTLFVQFIRPRLAFYDKANVLSNGFSHMYVECKSRGDFYWEIEEKDTIGAALQKKELPISSGRIYVSAFYAPQVFQACYWAERYPDIEVIVGGPAIICARNGFYSEKGFPKNVVFLSSYLEDVFGHAPNHQLWGLEPPSNLEGKTLLSYAVSRHCYWGKCLFCNKEEHANRDLIDVNNPIASLILPQDLGVEWHVFFLLSSLPPEFIRKDLPLIPKLGIKRGDVFLRADESTIQPLKEVIDSIIPGSIIFRIGVEFPSNRMLDMMKKGITTESILRIVEILAEKKHPFYFFLITGWNSLEESDIREVGHFLKQLPIKGIPCSLTSLCVGCGEERNSLLMKADGIMSAFPIDTRQSGHYKFRQQFPRLSEKALDLNRQVRELYRQYLNIKYDSSHLLLDDIWPQNTLN